MADILLAHEHVHGVRCVEDGCSVVVVERRPSVWRLIVVGVAVAVAAGGLGFAAGSASEGVESDQIVLQRDDLPSVKVPNFVGMTVTDAQRLAIDLGLGVSVGAPQDGEGAPEGFSESDVITSQQPAAETPIRIVVGEVRLTAGG